MINMSEYSEICLCLYICFYNDVLFVLEWLVIYKDFEIE